ncbi:hypothetical protein [Schlesneria sp.]|uniref:hypothetical protein n=1 Tax=Schlesneria sp. TaxID=2762018 RepID=UPI002F1C259D
MAVEFCWKLATGGRVMRLWCFLAIGLFVARTASAQLAVQQPVVSETGVGTVVSVPDRGEVFLGGVSSAQSGRIQNGPLPTVTSRGFSRQATSMSARVFIHDLQAMDEAILNSSSPVAPETAISPGTHASSLATRLKARRDADHVPPSAATDRSVDQAAKAARFQELAIKAEKAGKAGVAKLHWQMAAKYGSKRAETRSAQR